jgi:hypothetical protein
MPDGSADFRTVRGTGSRFREPGWEVTTMKKYAKPTVKPVSQSTVLRANS